MLINIIKDMKSATPLTFDTARLVTKAKYLSNPNKDLFKHDVDIDTGDSDRVSA